MSSIVIEGVEIVILMSKYNIFFLGKNHHIRQQNEVFLFMKLVFQHPRY